jgi:hypothetical protein
MAREKGESEVGAPFLTLGRGDSRSQAGIFLSFYFFAEKKPWKLVTPPIRKGHQVAQMPFCNFERVIEVIFGRFEGTRGLCGVTRRQAYLASNLAAKIPSLLRKGL